MVGNAHSCRVARDMPAVCPIKTEIPGGWLAPEGEPEIRAYKLGKRRWSYNQVELTLHEAGGPRQLSVAHAINLGTDSFTEDVRESAACFRLELTNRYTVFLHSFLCYDVGEGGSPGLHLRHHPPPDGYRHTWHMVTRAACRKGCDGPVLRVIQRFGKLGKRSWASRTHSLHQQDAPAPPGDGFGPACAALSPRLGSFSGAPGASRSAQRAGARHASRALSLGEGGLGSGGLLPAPSGGLHPAGSGTLSASGSGPHTPPGSHASAPLASPERSSNMKDPRFMYLSLDEAGTHVGARTFRLVSALYDCEGRRLLGTLASPPIRVLANNDVPTGAAHISLALSLPSSWEGWTAAPDGPFQSLGHCLPLGRAGGSSVNESPPGVGTPSVRGVARALEARGRGDLFHEPPAFQNPLHSPGHLPHPVHLGSPYGSLGPPSDAGAGIYPRALRARVHSPQLLGEEGNDGSSPLQVSSRLSAHDPQALLAAMQQQQWEQSQSLGYGSGAPTHAASPLSGYSGAYASPGGSRSQAGYAAHEGGYEGGDLGPFAQVMLRHLAHRGSPFVPKPSDPNAPASPGAAAEPKGGNLWGPLQALSAGSEATRGGEAHRALPMPLAQGLSSVSSASLAGSHGLHQSVGLGLHPHAAQPHHLLHPPHPLHDSPWGGLFAGGGEETPLSDATGLSHRGPAMPPSEALHRPAGGEHAGHSLAGHSLGGHSSHPSSWSLSPHPTTGSHDLGVDHGLTARTHGDLLNSSSGSCAANTPSHASYQLFHLANELARGAHPGEGDGQQSPCSFALFGSQGAANHPGAHVHAAAALLDGLGGLAEGYSPMRGGGAEAGEQGAASASGAATHAELFGDQTPRSQAGELANLPQTPTEELFSTDVAEGGGEGAEHALLGHQGFKLEEVGLVMR